jgi:hypothetical protein
VIDITLITSFQRKFICNTQKFLTNILPDPTNTYLASHWASIGEINGKIGRSRIRRRSPKRPDRRFG